MAPVACRHRCVPAIRLGDRLHLWHVRDIVKEYHSSLSWGENVSECKRKWSARSAWRCTGAFKQMFCLLLAYVYCSVSRRPQIILLSLKCLQLYCFHYQTLLLPPHESIAFSCTLFRWSARNASIIVSHALPHISSSKMIFAMFDTKGLHHTLWGALRFGRYLFSMKMFQNQEERIYNMRVLIKWF
jgi:hypothetical protein